MTDSIDINSFEKTQYNRFATFKEAREYFLYQKYFLSIFIHIEFAANNLFIIVKAQSENLP